MRRLTTGRLAALCIYALAVAVAAPLAAGFWARAEAQASRARVIVLPLANNTAVGGAELAERVHRALQLSLVASDRANIISVRPSSPAVRRAIDIEKTLDPSDLEIEPPADRGVAERLGRALGADFVLWGAVDEYAYDERAKQAALGLTVHKLDLRSGEVSSVAVTGKGVRKVGLEAAEGPLMTEAIDDAVAQVVQQVLGVSITGPAPRRAPAPAVTRKKDRTWETLGALLAVAVVAALAHDGGEAAPAAVGPTPITVARATPTADSVELSWEVSASANVAGFNVYRAEVGGTSRMARSARAPQSRVRLTRQASGYQQVAILGRSDRAFNDTTVDLGTLYAYQIAAVVGSAETARVDFYNTYEAAGVIEVGPAWPRAPAIPSYENRLQSVHLTWTPNPEPFIDSYRIYRSTSASGPWDDTTLRGQVPASETEFDDTGVVAGTTYYYAVGAVTAATGTNGRVGAARQVTFEPGKPAPPSDVRAEPRIEGVELFWTPSADTAVTGYRIYRNNVQIAEVSGRTTATYLDSPLAAGSYTYQVSSVAGTVESDRVTATPAPVSPSNPPSSLVLTQPAPVVANGYSTVNIIATVRDSASQPVQGAAVVFSLSGDGGTLIAHPSYPATEVPAGLRVMTDATGKAGVRFRAGTDPDATPVVTAACAGAGGVTLTDEVTITLEERVVSAITLEAEHLILPGDGISSTTLTATVTDQGGGPMAGVTVQFESDAPAIGVVNPTSAVTGDDGKAQTTLRSAAANQFGACTVTASALGAPQGTPTAQVTVHFVSPPRVTVSVDPRVLPAAGLGSTALITATVKYVTGEPVDDGTVIRFAFEGGDTMSVTAARIASGRERALTQGGIAYSTLISAADLSNGDSDVIWAWIDTDDDGEWDGPPEMLGSTVVTYTDPPYRVTLSAEPLSIPADGRSVSKIVADVRTEIPNPSGGGYLPVADGTLVEFVTSGGTFIETGTSTTSGRTVGGLVTVYLKSGTTAGVVNVTGTAALISGSVQVQFTAPVGITVTVTANPAALRANGTDTSQITARVLDSTTGEPKKGVTVEFATDLGSLSALSATTNNSGDATVTFTAGTRSGTATVVAKSGGVTGFTTLTLTSGQPQNLSLTILAPNTIMPATNGLTSPSGASPTAAVYARVTDRYGNPVIDGTPVFFHTDIGQIDGSALTENGLAQATLVTCNFLDATNKATYRPGWASITAYANNPAGPATAGPEYQIFCGDISAYNWDGSANDTDLWTGYGADWRLGTVGSATLAQPNVVPKAGDEIWFYMFLADRNNNPLPAGVTVHWVFRIGGTEIATVDSPTAIAEYPGGVKVCFSDASVTPTDFPDQVTVAELTALADAPTIIAWSQGYAVSQLVGAAGPAGTIEIVSDIGNQIQLSRNPDGPFTLSANLWDQYGNPVQDGNPVYFEIENPQNVSEATVNFSPNPAFTTGGKAVTGMTIGLLNEAQNGNFTIRAGSPQAPPGADAEGTLSITAIAPPQPTRWLMVDYDEVELVRTYDASAPGLYLIYPAFSVKNVGEASATVTITNVPDQSSPLNYITFRSHSADPPTEHGQKVLQVALGVGETLVVDVIVDTNGLTVAGSPYTSTIQVTSIDAAVTYAPAEYPQRTYISIQ